MNWVDIIVLAIIAVSALSAFVRGFVREVMGIGAWIGAAVAALWGAPGLQPRLLEWTGNAELSIALAYAAVFLGTLVLLSIVAGLIGSLVSGVGLGLVDSTLGIAFGIARGALLVIVAYFGAGYLVPPDRWPEPVQQARSMTYAAEGAAWLAGRLPLQYRPSVPPPPVVRDPLAADLLRVPAQGRANTPRP